jgi:hypothetical protein
MDIHVKRASQAVKEENENDNQMLTIRFPSRELPIDGRKELSCRLNSLCQITLSSKSFPEMVSAKACLRF